MDKQLVHRVEKLRVPVQEGIRGIQQNTKDRAPIINRVLAALGAELARQRRAAILAMRERLFRQFRPPPEAKDSAPSWRLFRNRRRGISQDDLIEFVAHGVRFISLPPRRDGHHRGPPGSGETRRCARVVHRLDPENFSRYDRARWSRPSTHWPPAIA